MSLVFIFEKGSSVSASKYLGSLVFKYVGSEQVLAGGLPGEGCEGEDRRNSWINIAPSSPPPTTLIPSPNHYRQDGGGGKFCVPLLDSFCLDIDFTDSAQSF